jgi:hypothetical protein
MKDITKWPSTSVSALITAASASLQHGSVPAPVFNPLPHKLQKGTMEPLLTSPKLYALAKLAREVKKARVQELERDVLKGKILVGLATVTGHPTIAARTLADFASVTRLMASSLLPAVSPSTHHQPSSLRPG